MVVWSSVSNASDKSINMDMGKSLSSKAEITRSISSIVANSVECFFLRSRIDRREIDYSLQSNLIVEETQPFRILLICKIVNILVDSHP